MKTGLIDAGGLFLDCIATKKLILPCLHSQNMDLYMKLLFLQKIWTVANFFLKSLQGDFSLNLSFLEKNLPISRKNNARPLFTTIFGQKLVISGIDSILNK